MVAPVSSPRHARRIIPVTEIAPVAAVGPSPEGQGPKLTPALPLTDKALLSDSTLGSLLTEQGARSR